MNNNFHMNKNVNFALLPDVKPKSKFHLVWILYSYYVLLNVYWIKKNNGKFRYIGPKGYEYLAKIFNTCFIYMTIVFWNHVIADGRTWQALEASHALSIWDDYANRSRKVQPVLSSTICGKCLICYGLSCTNVLYWWVYCKT